MSLCIYIAEDHPQFRKGFVRLLRSFNNVAEIREAENGKELIQLVQSRKPDVVFLDIRMPVMDGIETCTYLSHQFPTLPIIMLTMENDKNYIDLLMQKGAYSYLFKNSDPEEVEKTIHSVVEERTIIN